MAQGVHLYGVFTSVEFGYRLAFRSRDRAAVHRQRSTCRRQVLTECTLTKQWFDLVVGLDSLHSGVKWQHTR